MHRSADARLSGAPQLVGDEAVEKPVALMLAAKPEESSLRPAVPYEALRR